MRKALPICLAVLLIPNLAFQVTFGSLSGYVSYHLVRAAAGLRDNHDSNKEAA